MENDEAVSKAAPAPLTSEQREFMKLVGAITAGQSITESLGSQTIRGLQRIRDKELFKCDGFTRFDYWLDRSPDAPMNYDKFNRLEKALKNQGDVLFDFLDTVAFPFSKRRLLGKGDVRIEGKNLVVKLGEEEISVPLANQSRTITLLSRVVDRNNELERSDKLKKEQFKSLKKKLEAEKAPPPLNSITNDFFGTLLTFTGACAMMVAEAEKLSPEEKIAIRQQVFETIGLHTLRIDEALGLEAPESVKRGKLSD